MKLYCNAKINLTLNITGKRFDGYHLLDSIMQSVSLADEVYVRRADKITVNCSNPLFSGEKNIAYKAAKYFFEHTKINGGAKIEIKKGIPDAAGLGGGSTDAAGVILALDKLYNTNLSYEELCDIALIVGADVPFCLEGGTKRATGIGEVLTPTPKLKNCFFVIAKNAIKASTAKMYEYIDNAENTKLADNDAFLEAVALNDIEKAFGFSENAFSFLNGLYGIDSILNETNPIKVCLSGSGPSVFAVYENEADADFALKLLNEKKIEAYKTVPTDKSIIFE